MDIIAFRRIVIGVGRPLKSGEQSQKDNDLRDLHRDLHAYPLLVRDERRVPALRQWLAAILQKFAKILNEWEHPSVRVRPDFAKIE